VFQTPCKINENDNFRFLNSPIEGEKFRKVKMADMKMAAVTDRKPEKKKNEIELSTGLS